MQLKSHFNPFTKGRITVICVTLNYSSAFWIPMQSTDHVISWEENNLSTFFYEKLENLLEPIFLNTIHRNSISCWSILIKNYKVLERDSLIWYPSLKPFLCLNNLAYKKTINFFVFQFKTYGKYKKTNKKNYNITRRKVKVLHFVMMTRDAENPFSFI